ncbi:granulocyte colony-stimulating factor-like [Xyrichtys novacula]|uniref:Granulocyte colony-stimulating factor-like n=1 Tax=Xyrichtys novacula TaxID=13765 RepID=A0AAV1GQJ5_XYRNO|nr:granulocyte colony-stimulating factor-like [Xyrichtys novacula]
MSNLITNTPIISSYPPYKGSPKLSGTCRINLLDFITQMLAGMLWTPGCCLTNIMLSLPVVVLLHHLLFAVLVQSAPLSSSSDLPPSFREAAERVKTLVEKIMNDIPAVHSNTVDTEGLTLDPSTQTNLQRMVTSLGIPAAPVIKPPSERFSLDMCVSRMLLGSQLFHGLLGVLSPRLNGLSGLQHDLEDLQTHINKMKDVAQLSSNGEEDQNYNLDLSRNGRYDVQVAVHLTLTQLRSFCHDMIRTLRAITSQRLKAH